MRLFSNLERRGAVYYWRRRPPAEISCRIGKSHLRISLRTMDSRIARFRGAQMSALAERLFAMPIPAILTRQQASDLFSTAFSQHLTKLMQLREIDCADGRSLEGIAELERAKGHAYRMLSRFGAAPSSGERQHLLSSGLDEADADRALQELDTLRMTTASARSIGQIEQLLSTVGAEPDARNVTASKNIYFRALGEALIRSAEQVGQELPYDDLVEDSIAALLAAGAPSVAPSVEAAAPALQMPAPGPDHSAKAKGATASAASGPTIVALGELLCSNKQGEDKHWTPKTASQARSIFDLLQRFMSEKHGSALIADLRQDRLAAFDGFLRRILLKTYGKSPHDKSKTIREFETIAAEAESSKRGLEVGTRNRHWTFIGQLIEHADSTGVAVDERLNVAKFHVRQSKPARAQRPVPKEAAVAGLFHSPIYTGHAHWRRLDEPGQIVLHRAAYWVPIILVYSGMRREEACGLSVADIEFVDGTAYFNVRGNKFRRLKNEWSERNILVHPELIRLGFIGYFEKIRAILSSPAAHEPLPITGADATLVAEQKQVPVATPARTPDPIAEALNRELPDRHDAWPILLRILRDKQLLADSQLAAKRPDGIKFLRGLIKNRPAREAAIAAARDPSVVDLGQRLKDAHGPTMLAIRLLLSLEQSLCDLGQRLAAIRRETKRPPVRTRS